MKTRHTQVSDAHVKVHLTAVQIKYKYDAKQEMRKERERNGPSTKDAWQWQPRFSLSLLFENLSRVSKRYGKVAMHVVKICL